MKTITLDLEAYELLRRHRKGRQSLSQVVKEHFGRKHTIDEFRRVLDEVVLSEETLDAVDEQIELRQKDRPTRPFLRPTPKS